MDMRERVEREAAALEREWKTDPRWTGVVRHYNAKVAVYAPLRYPPPPARCAVPVFPAKE
ncbi:hypothetical protein HRbin32_00212 [bacterium HR32]|nr:hypothetical protein HRbin32_00212 [bacterium HR32]